MRKRRKAKARRTTAAVGSVDVTGVPSSSRRWVFLVAGAVCVATVLAYGITFLSSSDPERERLEDLIADQASNLSPDAALLLHEAGEVADTLLDRFPYSGDALDVVARLYHGSGRTDDAVRCWERCMELDSGLGPSLHAAIGSVAFEEGKLDSAAKHYRRAVDLDPGSSVYPVHLAEALIDRGKYEEAVEVLAKNLKAWPRSMPAHVLIGQAYFQLRQYEKARQHLEVGVEMGPEYTNAYYTLARACAALENREKSSEYLKVFKELQAKEEQQHRDALKAADETGEIRQVVTQIYTAAAKVYIKHGDYHAAQLHLIKAAELSPDEAECRIALAWLHEQQGHTDEALKTLSEIHARAPDDLGAQLSVAAAYARLDRFDEAEEAYRRAIELAPRQAGGYTALASFYLQAGRKADEAKTLALKAVEMEPVAKHYFLLSRACLESGDRAEAFTAVKQAVALDASDAQYQHLYEAIRKMD